MRKLNKRQQQILRRYPSAFSVEDLPCGVFQELEEIHDFETLWQCANRFLADQYFNHDEKCGANKK